MVHDFFFTPKILGKRIPNLDQSLFRRGWYVGVSKNSVTPKSSILIGFSIINHPFWDTPIFGNTHVVGSSFLSTRVLSGSRNFPSHRQGRDRSRWKPLESPKIVGTTLSRSQQLGKSGTAPRKKKKHEWNKSKLKTTPITSQEPSTLSFRAIHKRRFPQITPLLLFVYVRSPCHASHWNWGG